MARITSTAFGKHNRSRIGRPIVADSAVKSRREENFVTRAQRRAEGDAFDAQFGYSRIQEGSRRLGWLLDLNAVTISDEDGHERAGLDVYFLQQDGTTFKVTCLHDAYFYVSVQDDRYIAEVTQLLQRKFDFAAMRITICDKEDLNMPNHLSGRLHRYLRLSFFTVSDLVDVRNTLLPIVERNKRRPQAQIPVQADNRPPADFFETLADMREYDVPYVIRVAIDLDLRVGAWYSISVAGHSVELTWQKDMLEKAEPKILAFDIECTKAPLKFPDPAIDQVFMISYMIDGQGFLLINREVVSEDVRDFEYTPKPAYSGPFKVINLADELAVLRYFVQHIQEARPQIYVTYNGDKFDWPFLESRMRSYDIDMKTEIGVAENQGEYRARAAVHLDAFHWVKRDSYLPQGSQGLKAVTKYKLGYDPVEIDPEDMVRFACERPTEMASYSVSDAVATYCLYTTYIHNFIFSLCTIIPMKAEDVLRKGSGTLCETLLMVEAFKGNIICPNKQADLPLQFYKGHLLETETYVGGHVECLETGVYRSDLPYKFQLLPSTLQRLLDSVDRDLHFAIVTEGKVKIDDVLNYAEVKQEIVERLADLRDNPMREETPLIYHLDVGAMYPNIILTNRLQPSSIVDQADCAACDFNQEKNACKRPMKWVWRGDHLPATRPDFEQVQTQLSYERTYQDAAPPERTKKLRDRLKMYSHKVYKKMRVTSQEEREDTVCMRENPFYVNTVRAFRDRRYEYKILTKKWAQVKRRAEETNDNLAYKAAEVKEIVCDSLQLAHKCILNSFYGYVMRRGARWRSMQMAGIVTDTGARLITQARELIENIGRPLELDTDGIWCILPASFPENFTLQTTVGRKINVSYPCVMLNADVHENYTNHQYQTLVDSATRRYEMHSECSIFFEVDGPYRCMVLPASTEEGKLLKKRYAVFNQDCSLAELKGFELKRRGELELVKAFQGQVFECFLQGQTLVECYQAVAEVANYWLDVLQSQGEELDDDEVMTLISENKTISRTLEEYADQKGTSLTTANRLADFLGPDLVKGKGLNCRLVIANRPHGAAVTDRAIPMAIFSAEASVQKQFLRMWLKDSSMSDFDIRSIIDWKYYTERLGKTIQKIITIPAAMQKIPNPVPRIPLPDWLDKQIRETSEGHRQLKIDRFFASKASQPLRDANNMNMVNDSTVCASIPAEMPVVRDIEDVGNATSAQSERGPRAAVVRRVMQGKENMLKQPVQAPRDLPSIEMGKRCPGILEDFQGWLGFRKAQWRSARLENRLATRGSSRRLGERRGRGSESQALAPAAKRQTVESLVRDTALAITQGCWQVIEVRETESPGEFVIWAMIGPRSLQRLSLVVDRTFYVTSTLDHEHEFLGLGARKVSRFLPHGHRHPFTYQLTIGEYKFLHHENDIASLLCTPGVTSVNELQTPLHFRAIVHMGCLAQVSARHQSRSAKSFRLIDLDSVSTVSRPYMTSDSAVYRCLYLYVSQSGRRAVVALFILSGDNRELVLDASSNQNRPFDATAHVWLATAYTTAESKPPLRRFFSRYAPARATCDFTSSHVATWANAMTQLNLTLASYLSERNGPTILLAQSPFDLSLLRRHAPCLNDMPVILMPSNADDNRYPALNWQAYATQRMIQRFLCMPAWLQDRLQCARYAQVPLSNLGVDAQRTMADVLLGRLLTANRHVLWASENTRPDLGGAEDDENDAWATEPLSPRIRAPGAYRKICVEMEVDGVAVLSILSGSASEDVDGTQGVAACDGMRTASAAEPGASVGGSDDPVRSGAFRLLRVLVDTWMSEVEKMGSPQADTLATNFWRWMCDVDSLLYDPALYRTCLVLMNRYFHRLVAEMRRLGALVIFANAQRIIIATNKDDMASAYEYANFVIDTVLCRRSFYRLQITPVRYWWQLVFMDEHNYGGLEYHEPQLEAEDVEEAQQSVAEHLAATATTAGALPPEDQQPQRESESEAAEEEWSEQGEGKQKELDTDAGGPIIKGRRRIVDDDDEAEEKMLPEETAEVNAERQLIKPDQQQMDVQAAGDDNAVEPDYELRSHWDMLRYLPAALRHPFDFIIATILVEYLAEERRRKLERQQRMEELSASTVVANEDDRLLRHDMILQEMQREEKHDVGMAKFLQKLVEGRMTRTLLRIVCDIDNEMRGPECFPDMVGSHKALTKPALEFVKAVCNILQLDTTIETQVIVLRRQLLAQLDIREFSEEEMSSDYCRSFVIHDLICTFCSHCRDLDICRDDGLTSEDPEQWWRCPHCANRYDVPRIEQLLIEAVERTVTRYTLQDVRCRKCKQPNTRAMADTCICAGRFEGEESPESVLSVLTVLRRAAIYYNLPDLQEIVDRALRILPDDSVETEKLQQSAKWTLADTY